MSITICDTHLVRTVRYLSLTFEPVYDSSFFYALFSKIQTQNKVDYVIETYVSYMRNIQKFVI